MDKDTGPLKYAETIKKFKESKHYRDFQTYHPFLTFSDPMNDRFIKPDGEKGRELNPDTEALFNIGLEAFKFLPNTLNEFEEGYENYFQFIRFHTLLLEEAIQTGALKVLDSTSNEKILNWMPDDTQIVDVVWKMFSRRPNEVDEETKNEFIELYAYHALREIDNAFVGMHLDGREAICAAIGASNALSNAIAISSRDAKLIEARQELAYRGALAKMENDPKQKALKEIRIHYDENKAQFKRRGFTAQFVRDMHDKYPIIKEQKTIANLVAKLNKSNELIPR